MTKQELNSLKNKYDIIGNSPELNRALEIAMTVAPTDLTVLVTGESGVGKENIPAIIHRNSLRKGGKYFAVNCGAIPEGTIDSELFGHEKGSFTGAVEMRKGYFEEANGGTIFLDEVGELPMASQAKLLRVLQSGEFMRVGSSKVLRTDVRVIAATNVDLMHAIGRGKFREDLYYRLNAVPISMPALRERKDDIHLLFRKFAADFSDKYSMAPIRLSDDAAALLRTYRWPGNIRQLKNVAETVSAMESTRMTPGAGRVEIDAAVLAKYLPHEERSQLPATMRGEADSLSQDEREAIIKALFQLKQDVDSLKAAVFGGGGTAAQPARASLPQWEDAMGPDEQAFESDAQNFDHEEFDAAQPLSIPEVREEMLRKALEKHTSRKDAAKALGISERTLYRKIKELGL